MGKTLDLNSKVTLKLVFEADLQEIDPNDLSLRISYRDYEGSLQETAIMGAVPYTTQAGRYVFSFDGLLATELRTVISGQVYYGDEAVSDILQYSADTYGNDKSGLLGTLCKALFAYSDSAKVFFS